MNFGDTLTPPTVTRPGYAFQGWNISPPATVTGDATYTAQWVETIVGVTMVDDELVINIVGYANDYSYQIWTYQKVTSDLNLDGESNVQANQWILSQVYTLGSAGTPGAGGSINFAIDTFTSPNNNYTIAVRIIAANGTYIGEMRDSYAPEVVGVAQIAKVLVDGEYVRGSSQEDRDNNIKSAAVIKEIKANAAPMIKVIGNSATGITYTATVMETSETLTATGNEFAWDISGLVPRAYTVRVTASKGETTDTWDISFVLYMSAAPTVPYGVLNSMTLTGGTPYSAPQYININANFSNGYFYYTVGEAGRSWTSTSEKYTATGDFECKIGQYGIYRVIGYSNRSAISPFGRYFDDGNAQTIEIKRAVGTTTTTLTANVNLSNPVNKGTAILFDSTATIAGIGTMDVEYSYWRQDAGGYVLVKDWSLDSTLAWTPGRVGNYKIEVRAKGVDAGSYEAIKSVWVNVVSTEEIAKNVVFTINTAELNSAQPWTPIVVKVSATSDSADLLYKFNVQEPMFDAVTKQNYSPNQEFVWTPKKAGDYKISVLVKNQNSFGQFDAIEQFTVTVD